MSVAGNFGMNACPAEVFLRNLFTQHGFNYVWPGDEHFRYVLHHEHEVREGRGVHRAASARAEDDRYLRDNPRGHGVAVEYLAVARQRTDAFLDARPAGVVDADARHFQLQRVIHDFGYLAGVLQPQRTAHDGEILRINAHRRAVDGACPRDNAIARQLFPVHAEVAFLVFDKHVILMKRPRIQQGQDTFAGRQLAHGNLFLDGFVAAAFLHDCLFQTQCFYILL